MTAPTRVASWPHAYEPNPYLPTMYAALEREGIAHVADVPLELPSFSGPGRVAEVVHLHWLYPLFRGGRFGPLGSRRRVRAGLARLRALREAGVPLIWTVHNVRPHDGFRFGERAGYAWAHRNVDLRVFHSVSAREAARALYGPEGAESIIVPHGTYSGAFPEPSPPSEVRARLGVAEGTRLLLCFGQIRSYKGFDIAVGAMRELRGEPFHLVVAGRPIDGSFKICQSRSRGLDHVTLLPEVIDARGTADLFHASDVVLLPYRSITGSGVLLHALTAGRGVVATDLPYFREVLAPDPEAGELVSPGERALADGVRKFFSVGEDVRRAAATRLATRYMWSRTVRPLAEWILANPRGS